MQDGGIVKNISSTILLFLLAQEAQRKSLAKRKRRFYGLCPDPQAFEKVGSADIPVSFIV